MKRGILWGLAGLIALLAWVGSPASAKADYWYRGRLYRGDPPPGYVYEPPPDGYACTNGYCPEQPRQRAENGDWKGRPHFYLGVRGGGLFAVDNSTDYRHGYIDDGGGVGFLAGVRLGPMVSLEFNWMTTFHDSDFLRPSADANLDSLYLMSFTGTLGLHIPMRGPLDPYIFGSGGWAYLGADYDSPFDLDHVLAKGGMFNAGIGLDIWLGRWVTIGGRVGYQGNWFGRPDPEFVSVVGSRHTDYVSSVLLDGSLAVHF